METSQLVISVVLVFIAIVTNGLALQGAVRSSFRATIGRKQNQSVINYQQCLVSLLSSNVYVCATNAVLLILSTVAELRGQHDSIALSSSIFSVMHRVILVGFLANLLNYCVISFGHFAQVVSPHASNNFKIFGRKSAADVAICVTWALSFIAGFIDYPIMALQSAGDEDDNAMAIIKPMGAIPFPRPNTNRSLLMLNKTDFISRRKIIFTTTPVNLRHRIAFSLRSNNLSTTTIAGSSLEENQDISFWYKVAEFLEGSPTYKTWIECLVFLLAIALMFFLVILCAVVVRKTNKVISRVRLRRSMVTAILLLACFIACWLPLVCYDMLFLLPALFSNGDEEDDDVLINSSSVGGLISLTPTAEVDAILHPICFTIFMLSPITPPIIFICRNQRVQKSLLSRYGCLLPAYLVERSLSSVSSSGMTARSYPGSIRSGVNTCDTPLLYCRSGSDQPSAIRVGDMTLLVETSFV